MVHHEVAIFCQISEKLNLQEPSVGKQGFLGQETVRFHDDAEVGGELVTSKSYLIFPESLYFIMFIQYVVTCRKIF